MTHPTFAVNTQNNAAFLDLGHKDSSARPGLRQKKFYQPRFKIFSRTADKTSV